LLPLLLASPVPGQYLFLFSSAERRSLTSFPTRRSSDLSRSRWSSHPEGSLRGLEAVLGVGGLHLLPGDPQEVEDRVEEGDVHRGDRKSTRLNSSHVKISYAVFCLIK